MVHAVERFALQRCLCKKTYAMPCPRRHHMRGANHASADLRHKHESEGQTASRRKVSRHSSCAHMGRTENFTQRLQQLSDGTEKHPGPLLSHIQTSEHRNLTVHTMPVGQLEALAFSIATTMWEPKRSSFKLTNPGVAVFALAPST